MEIKFREFLFVVALIAGIGAVGMMLPSRVDAAASDDLGPSTASQSNAIREYRVDSGASERSFEFEWCPGTAVTTAVVNKQYVTGAKSLYCENRSSATIYLTLDAVNLTTTGSTGYRLLPGSPMSWDGSATTFGPKFKTAATAQTTTGACLWCAWLR